jgi:hypothetical protein
MTRRPGIALLLGLAAAATIGSTAGAAPTTTSTLPATTTTTTTTTTAPLISPAPVKSTKVHGSIIAMTNPLPDGTMWVLTGTAAKKTMFQVNVNTGKSVGSEGVSPHTDGIALSPNNATLALATTGGAYPAVVWYSALTGRFANASRQPAPVTGVATNTSGNVLYALRGSAGVPSVFALGTSNGLGYTFAIPVGTVDIAQTPQGSLLVLGSSGIVGTLALPKGSYTNGFTTGAPAQDMALSPDGSTLFVLRSRRGTGAVGSIAEVDVAAGTVVETIPVSNNCVDIVLSADGHTLFEAIRGRSTSTVKPIIVP